MNLKRSTFTHNVDFTAFSNLGLPRTVSHVKFNSGIKQSLAQEKITEAKIEKFSDAVTTILRSEAAAKLKKLVYVFVDVNQLSATSFNHKIDDSRDKISDKSAKMISAKFEEIFSSSAT